MKKQKYIRFLAPAYILVIGLFLFMAYAGSQAVTTLSESAGVSHRKTIIIDPGHGGEDGGAVSCTGIPESRFNLEISLRLNDLLHLMGYKTVMLRTEDISIYTEGSTLAAKKVSDLKQRVKLVNEEDDALLVSIHQNMFSDSKYNGAQVFYANTESSKALAVALQQQFVTSLNPQSNRKAKKSDGVYLMEHINKDGILVECGFLSNYEEECKLRDKDYQNKICCVIATVLSRHLTA